MIQDLIKLPGLFNDFPCLEICTGSFQGVCVLCVTYESLEEVALEDVDDPLDGVSELPVLGVLQLGPVLLEQQQSSLCIWATGRGSSRGEARIRQRRAGRRRRFILGLDD